MGGTTESDAPAFGSVLAALGPVDGFRRSVNACRKPGNIHHHAVCGGPIIGHRVDLSDLNRIDTQILTGHVQKRVKGKLGQHNLLPPHSAAGCSIRIDQFTTVLDRRDLVGDI